MQGLNIVLIQTLKGEQKETQAYVRQESHGNN